MGIPEARDKLEAIACTLRHGSVECGWAADEIEQIIKGHMYRKPPHRPRAEVTSVEISPELAAEVKKFANGKGKEWSNQKIANKYGFNPGRVRDIPDGKYD